MGRANIYSMQDVGRKDKHLQIIQNLEQLHIEGSSAIAIGKFDGIHIGHQALLEKVLEKKEEGMVAVVFTFSPSPEEFFKGVSLPVIDTVEEKRENFQNMGIDILIEYPLTKESAAISPEDFMQVILWEKLHAGYVVSGTDLSFGDKGRGNADMLAAFAREHSFLYEEIDKICIDGKEVSSTAVRSAVTEGDMELVMSMLGRAYRIGGEVVHGRALGRTIQVPTVNVIPQKQKLLPPRGVYATVSDFDGRKILGVTNIGCKPTVSNENQIGVETHLFDFDEEIYGEHMVTWLMHYIRPEMKFENLEALVEQLQLDEVAGRAYFGEICQDITNIM